MDAQTRSSVRPRHARRRPDRRPRPASAGTGRRRPLSGPRGSHSRTWWEWAVAPGAAPSKRPSRRPESPPRTRVGTPRLEPIPSWSDPTRGDMMDARDSPIRRDAPACEPNRPTRRGPTDALRRSASPPAGPRPLRDGSPRGGVPSRAAHLDERPALRAVALVPSGETTPRDAGAPRARSPSKFRDAGLRGSAWHVAPSAPPIRAAYPASAAPFRLVRSFTPPVPPGSSSK